ncbi:putative serine/threonine-protein kinase [Sesbania bispinosa]|nr:putative serine/threonine-protein kinase [Sesbania bispinosa]
MTFNGGERRSSTATNSGLLRSTHISPDAMAAATVSLRCVSQPRALGRTKWEKGGFS